MIWISPLCREGILKDVDIVPFMYYDIPNNDLEQLDLPFSPFSKFYTKFAPLYPEDDPQMIIQTKHERLETFYAKNALPLKEFWSQKRITKISGLRRKIMTKFELNCILFRFHIFRNKPTCKIITDSDFPACS